jgi:ribosome modulation factor
MAVDEKKPWRQGYNAGANLEPVSSNPYFGFQHEQWLDGWHTGIEPDHEVPGNNA